MTSHPNSQPHPPEIGSALQTAVAALPAQFAPRTRHFGGQEHKTGGEHPDPVAPKGSKANYVNRLLLENSPYLRQHAFNPVDWRPWGPAAFAEARQLNRPIFLSIGYATCHWCHVMEHESFEDLPIASLLNSLYVPVKVDREERPDVDAVYMAAVQAMTGHGGWPMSVFLAPDPSETTGVRGLPFFAGTYFPAHDGDRGARTGFATILKHFAQTWAQNPSGVVRDGQRIAAHIAEELTATGAAGDAPTRAAIDRAVAVSAQSYDAEQGGRQGAPKFPSQMPLSLLCRHYLRTGDRQSLHMAHHTLVQMARGGMYDQVGGGFHRYSTDARWFAPHFEKMLYDQGLILMGALDVWQITGDPFVRRTIADTLDYLLREMQHPLGGFYSATDADSQGKEGLFFVWTIEQLRGVLGQADGDLLARVFNCSQRGNFEGSNILHLRKSHAELASQEQQSEAELVPRLAAALARLRQARTLRIAPLRDDKVLPAWNGLAISALARASWLLKEPRWLTAAERAGSFVWTQLRSNGRLQRSWVDGTAKGFGFLDDYAFMTQAYLDLHEASGDAQWLAHAMELQAQTDLRFADSAHGGYFSTPDDAEVLLARAKPDRDGAEPAGNSVAANNLVRLHALTGAQSYQRKVTALWQAFAGRVAQYPFVLTEMLLGVESYAWPMREVVLVRPANAPLIATEPLLQVLRANFGPHRVVLHVQEGAHQEELAKLTPLVADKVAKGGQVTAYVCRHGVCELPTSDPAVFKAQLGLVLN